MKHKDSSTAGFIRHFATLYPGRTLLMVASITAAGFFEAISVVTVLPLLEVLAPPDQASPGVLAETIRSILEAIGLTPSLGILLGVILTMTTAKALMLWFAMRQVGFTVARVTTDLREELVVRLFQVRWAHYSSQPIGHITNAVGSEAYRASSAYREACNFLSNGIQVLVYGLIAIVVSWQVALAGALLGLIFAASLKGFMNRAAVAGVEQTEVSRRLIGRMTDVFRDVKTIRAMGREDGFLPILREDIWRLNEAMRKQVTAFEGVRLVHEPGVAAALAGGIVLAVGVATVPLPTVLLMAFIFYRVMAKVNAMQLNLQTVREGESAFWALQDEIRSAEANMESPGGKEPVPIVTDGIEFRHVSFAYATHYVLKDLSLVIPARRLVALYGSSGVGKTTLADMIMGLHQPTDGSILIDGIPLESFPVTFWRRTIGYVPQDPFLMNDTIKRNVSLGAGSVSDQSIIEALRRAGAWDFVSKRSKGIDSVVGEGGTKLSGGQRQRLAIARALVNSPQVLILDEATTALDPATEASIISTLHSLKASMTILAISHQSALRRAADVVYEFSEGGRVKLAANELSAATRGDNADSDEGGQSDRGKWVTRSEGIGSGVPTHEGHRSERSDAGGR